MSCRRIYREALGETNLVRASALLQQMQPALSKAARWWHLQTERDDVARKANDSISKSLRLSFWYHWQSNSNHGHEVYGRRLEKFCRGEELDDRLTSRLAPWWK